MGFNSNRRHKNFARNDLKYFPIEFNFYYSFLLKFLLQLLPASDASA